MTNQNYQEQARVWMAWYVMWEDILPKMAKQDIEARLEKIDDRPDHTHYSLDDGL